nr:uncharacterized protein LOC131278323 [Dasypus novemcinctus]
MLPTTLPPDSPSRPSALSPEPTPRLTRRDRRRNRLLAHRMRQLTISDPEDPLQPQILHLLRLARAQASSTTPPAQNTPVLLHILIIMLSLASSAVANNAHQPFNWTLHAWPSKSVLSFNVTSGSPSFTTHICTLAGIPWHATSQGHVIQTECRGDPSRHGLYGPYNYDIFGFYICPSSARGCHDLSHYFCPSWGCETMAYGWSGAPNRDPHLSFRSINTSRWDFIILSVKQPSDDTWLAGRSFGIRLYKEGYDYGALFEIQKRLATSSHSPSAVGPNQILNPPSPRTSPSPRPSSSSNTSFSNITSPSTNPPSPHNPKPQSPPIPYSNPLS